jgi:hypothetical protein
VVAPAEGAKVVPASNVASADENTASATDDTAKATKSTSKTSTAAAKPATSNSPATAVAKTADLKYPFTFLEIRENDKTVQPASSDEPNA